MRSAILIISALALVGCSDSSPIRPPIPPLPPVTSFSTDPVRWTFQHSPGLGKPSTAAPIGWYFDFPQGPEAAGTPSAHYVVTPAGGGLTTSGMLKAQFIIEETGTPIYQYKLRPDNTCDAPANVSLYMQRVGDDLTAAKQYYRWWTVGSYQIKAGQHTFAAPLQPAAWLSVLGIHGDKQPAEFAAAKQNLSVLGLTFGGGCFKGHGVNVKPGSGTSRFTLVSFTAG